jgi:peptidoglycan/LPS O-acetylase OafA/YrhL
VAFVGVLSYTLYLVHQVAMMGLHLWLPGLHQVAFAMLAFAIAFAVALASYRFVEKPCARLRQRLARGAPVARAPAVR